MTFFVPIFDDYRGVYELHHRAIAMNYVQLWFWIDLVSVMPYDFMGGGTSLKALRIIRLARLFKLLRLFKAKRSFRNFETHYNINYNLMALFKFIIIGDAGEHQWFEAAAAAAGR